MAGVERLSSEVASTTALFIPGICARRRNMPRLIARLARRTGSTTASLVKPRVATNFTADPGAGVGGVLICPAGF